MKTKKDAKSEKAGDVTVKNESQQDQDEVANKKLDALQTDAKEVGHAREKDVSDINTVAQKTPTLVKKTKRQDSPMNALIASSPSSYCEGDLAEGEVIALDRAAVYIDLPPFGTGIIYGLEFINSRDIIKKLNTGDTIKAKVIVEENEDGYIELSLKEARRAMIWSDAERLMNEKTPIDLMVKEANKGGLILDWQGISGFLPASQLNTEHYPKVEGGDKNQILEELRSLIGQRISVSILSIQPKEAKLIFTEKYEVQKEKQEIVEKYNIGDELEGEVTGIVEFGVFVKVEEDLEGLVHISEIDWGLVDDPRSFVSVGDKVKVKVIEIKDGKISLSIKQLKPNPWQEAAERYRPGKKVDGVIMKYNRHGALASVEEGIAGLVHVSEFNGSEEKLKETLELGKSYPFVVTVFDDKAQKMALSHKQVVGNNKENSI